MRVLSETLVREVNRVVEGWREARLPAEDDDAWRQWLAEHRCPYDSCRGQQLLHRDDVRDSIKRRVLAQAVAPFPVAALGVHRRDASRVGPQELYRFPEMNPELTRFAWEATRTFGELAERYQEELVGRYNDLLMKLCFAADEPLMREILPSFHPEGARGITREFLVGQFREPDARKRRLVWERLAELIRARRDDVRKAHAAHDPRNGGFKDPLLWLYVEMVNDTFLMEKGEHREPELAREQLAFLGSLEGEPFPRISDWNWRPIMRILAGDASLLPRARWTERFYCRPDVIRISSAEGETVVPDVMRIYSEEDAVAAAALIDELVTAGDPLGTVPVLRERLEEGRRHIARLAARRAVERLAETARLKSEGSSLAALH